MSGGPPADRAPFAVLDAGREVSVTARVSGARVLLGAEARAALGWPGAPGAAERDLAEMAAGLDRPLALDAEERAAWVGVSARVRSDALRSLRAPDFALPDLGGRTHRLSDHRGSKVFLVAYASWCGCRLDLPVWQALHEELRSARFTVITVALDRDAEAARPWIEAARPTHPALIDPWHVVADLYNMVNVPTAVWIDEAGQIARPQDVAFGTDTFRQITGIDSSRHVGALRAWARGEAPLLPADRTRALLSLPTPADQAARAHFALAMWLWLRGRSGAAGRHFARAGELAPQDFTIRRGSMPIRGIDPMGPEFRAMVKAWAEAGHRYYVPLAE